MRAIHHTAIVTTDVELALRFWRDGLGLNQYFEKTYTGDRPGLFGADSEVLCSVCPADPEHSHAGIVELVRSIGGLNAAEPTGAGAVPPRAGRKQVAMPVPTAPDSVLIELIGPPE